MRWDGQRVGASGDDPNDDGQPTLPAMPGLPGLVRVVRPPEFAGMTFHEVNAKSVLNEVPAASAMPFRWTVNPYRGCSHQCTYCFARNTHTYLEFDAGDDFDRQVVVKTNVATVLRRELARRSWRREHVALGTNTDPYQRAEGRYRLMPGIIAALADSGTPFSILTKGTLLARDLDLLVAAAQRVPVGIGLSLALLDEKLQASLEPGTPSPKARLQLIRRITQAGLPCGVLAAPLLPGLTDSQQQIDDLVGAIAEAGATGVSCIGLHLRPGTKEWFLAWLGREHPGLAEYYAALYRRGAYLPKDHRDALERRFRRAVRASGLAGFGSGAFRREAQGVPGDEQAWFPRGSMPDPRGSRDPHPAHRTRSASEPRHPASDEPEQLTLL